MANIIRTKAKNYGDLVSPTPTRQPTSLGPTVSAPIDPNQRIPECGSKNKEGAYINLTQIPFSATDNYKSLAATKESVTSWEMIKRKFANKWTFPFPVIAIGWLESNPPDRNNGFVYKFDKSKGTLRPGGILPKWVVIHHTAGLYSNDDPVNTYKYWNNTPVGADFTLARGGQVAGMVNFHKKSSGHYGVSTFKGVLGEMNFKSIGLETVGLGQCFHCTKDTRTYPGTNAQYLYDAYGRLYTNNDMLDKKIYLNDRAYRSHKLWHVFTDEQIFAIANLVTAMVIGGAIKDYDTFIQNMTGTDRYNRIFNEDAWPSDIAPPPDGIITHGTGRLRGAKVDILPQSNLIEMLDDLPNIISRGGKLDAFSSFPAAKRNSPDLNIKWIYQNEWEEYKKIWPGKPGL